MKTTFEIIECFGNFADDFFITVKYMTKIRTYKYEDNYFQQVNFINRNIFEYKKYSIYILENNKYYEIMKDRIIDYILYFEECISTDYEHINDE